MLRPVVPLSLSVPLSLLLLVFVTTAASGQLQPGDLYGVQSSGSNAQLLRINTDTGVAAPVGAQHGFLIDGLAFDEDRLYAADNTSHRLVRIDPITGSVAVAIGPFGITDSIEGMSFNPVSGELFGVAPATNHLLRISTLTGSAATVGTLPGIPPNLIGGLAWSVDGTRLYASVFGDGLYEIDPVTAATTRIGGAGEGYLALDIDPTTGTAYAMDFGPADLLTVDLSTGATGTVGNTGFSRVEGLAFVRPEPVVVASVLGHEPFTTESTPATGDPVSVIRVITSSPVAFTDADIEVRNGQNQSVAFASGGSGGQVISIMLATPLSGDDYTVTVRDSAISAESGTPIDGDGDGTPGGDAVLSINHRCLADDNGDGEVTPSDFSAWVLNFNTGC